MQTFLPFESFPKSASHLDNSRLNKQLVECWQIFNAIRKNWRHEKAARVNHPAVLQWVQSPGCYLLYCKAIAAEYEKRRQVTHASFAKIMEEQEAFVKECPFVCKVDYPEWLGNEELHANHRGRLKFKGALDALRVRLAMAKSMGVDCTGVTKHTNLRNYKIADYDAMTQFLDSRGVGPGPKNWYDHFRWSEPFAETNIWPVQQGTSA